MQEIDQVVSKVLKLEPRTSAPVVKQPVTPLSIGCTVFEDYTPYKIYSIWSFGTPSVAAEVKVDLCRLLRNVDIGNQQQTRQLFARFSDAVNQSRTKAYSSNATEEDILCYLNFMGVLKVLFENNSMRYSYRLDVTEEVIHSDRFLFEYLQTLVALLANYDRQQANLQNKPEANAGQLQISLCDLSIAVLTEILSQCDQPNEGNKLLYIEPPRSISMDQGRGVVVRAESERPTCLSMKEYIASFLGGPTAIEARIQLCVAKEKEALFAITGECAYMTAAHKAYKQVSLLVKGSEEALYKHSRFLAHYWFCKAHFFLAKRDAADLIEPLNARCESDEQLEKATLVLARLMLVTKEARLMEDNEKDMIENLSIELEDSYNALIEELFSLTALFNKELYDRRETKEKEGVKLGMPVFREEARPVTVLAEKRQAARKRYMEKHPQIGEAQQLLRSLNEKLKKGEVVGPLLLKPPTPVAEPLVERIHYWQKIGVFEEREPWLEWIISTYSPIDHEFVISGDLYDTFLKALDEVKEAKKRIIK